MRLIILLILLLANILLHAQDNCAVYEAVLNVLIAQEKSIEDEYIVPQEGIDATDTFAGYKTKIDYQHSLYFYVMPEVLEFSEKNVNFFANEVSDSSLRLLDYRATIDTIIKCVFNKTFRYKYSTFDEARFDETHFFWEVEGDSVVYYSPAKVAFSNVLYYKDKLALVYIKTKIKMGGGRDATYLFVFEKRNDVWVLKRKAYQQG